MANRYWVGGSGTWSSATTNWSETSGGASGATAPGSSDDVFFDANSGSGSYTVTFANSVSAQSINIDKPTSGTIAWTGGVAANTISVYGNIAVLTDSSNFTTNSAMTIVAVTNSTIQSNGANFATHRLRISNGSANITLANLLTIDQFEMLGGR